MKPDLYWIPGPWKGKLAVAPRPRGGDWLADEVRDWQGAGLDDVISLLELLEATQLELGDEARLASARNIQFLSFPIPDRGVPASTADARSLALNILSRLNAGERVAIHCRQGIGRSGLIAASVLMAAGIEIEEAVQTVSEARGLPIPETEAQRAWLQRFAPDATTVAS
jgi:protein-tyrosine phosphatase